MVPTTKDPELERLGRAYEAYFDVADPRKIGEIRRDIFFFRKPFLEREKAYLQHKKTIGELKPLYKDLVKARNKYAQSKGPYRNFLHFALNDDGVPEKSFEKFLEQIDSLINRINKNLPKPKNSGQFYSPLNMPDFIDEISSKKYSLPEYVIRRLGEYSPEIGQMLPRIRFEDADKNHGFNEALFRPVTGTVVVRTWPSSDLQHAISLAHEVGHAVAYLRLIKEGIDPKDKPKYWHEKQAIRMELTFIGTLPQDLRNAAIGNILWQFTIALFEVETYAKPNLNFDRVFAQSFNRCYKEAQQKENPFYVVMEPLLRRPCSAVTQGIVHTGELSQVLN